MKKTSKLIASISLSLLTVGAMAQNAPVTSLGYHPQPKIVTTPVTKGIHDPQNNINIAPGRVSGLPVYQAEFNYPDWDYSITTGNSGDYQGVNSGWGVIEVNSAYAVGDTGATKFDKNYELIQSATVAFDSLWDVYSQTMLDPKATTITSIDTVWALVGYKNTTHTAGKIIFQGLNTSSGYPGATVLFSDTITVGASIKQDTTGGRQYFGDSLDHLYYLYVTPNYTPSPATKSFAVKVTYVGSKSDTFEVAYGFPYFYCNPYNYAEMSSVGIDLNGLYSCNTFTTGWYKVFNKVTEMPTNAGGFVYYGVACGDTGFYYEQDAAIIAAVKYNYNLGINNVTASGLSVNQNYPNPFNKTSQITYNLVNSSNVVFTVCDITGRVMINNVYNSVQPGKHEINLNANTFAPGVYFYTFKVNGNEVTKKMVITE